MFQRTGGPFLSRDKKGIPSAGEAVNLLHEPSTVVSKADIQRTLYKLEHNTFRRLMDESALFREKMLIMRHGFKSITFSAYKERLLKLFRMAADRSQLVDDRWNNQQMQYTQNDVSIIIRSSRITVSKPLNKSCEEGIIRMLNRRIQINVHLKPEELLFVLLDIYGRASLHCKKGSDRIGCIRRRPRMV